MGKRFTVTCRLTRLNEFSKGVTWGLSDNDSWKTAGDSPADSGHLHDLLLKFGHFCGKENDFKTCHLNCRRHLCVDYPIT